LYINDYRTKTQKKNNNNQIEWIQNLENKEKKLSSLKTSKCEKKNSRVTIRTKLSISVNLHLKKQTNKQTKNIILLYKLTI
jgi:hypothetical protein